MSPCVWSFLLSAAAAVPACRTNIARMANEYNLFMKTLLKGNELGRPNCLKVPGSVEISFRDLQRLLIANPPHRRSVHDLVGLSWRI
jgi:hypothetical protein